MAAKRGGAGGSARIAAGMRARGEIKRYEVFRNAFEMATVDIDRNRGVHTDELIASALDMPFLLLPFRPASDPVAARSFIRNYFNADRPYQLHGDRLSQELLLTEPTVSALHPRPSRRTANLGRFSVGS